MASFGGQQCAEPVSEKELERVTAEGMDAQTLFWIVTTGDLSNLSREKQLAYYKIRCERAGVDWRTVPFQLIRLQGKLVLYATKAATDQLAAQNGIRAEIVSQQTDNGARVVTVRVTAKDGRQTDDVGVVTIEGLKGDALCNAYMKAVTKARRRAIISICGLGLLDETELETVHANGIGIPELPRVPSTKPDNGTPPPAAASIPIIPQLPEASVPPATEPPSAEPTPRPASSDSPETGQVAAPSQVPTEQFAAPKGTNVERAGKYARETLATTKMKRPADTLHRYFCKCAKATAFKEIPEATVSSMLDLLDRVLVKRGPQGVADVIEDALKSGG